MKNKSNCYEYFKSNRYETVIDKKNARILEIELNNIEVNKKVIII